MEGQNAGRTVYGNVGKQISEASSEIIHKLHIYIRRMILLEGEGGEGLEKI